MTIKVAAIVGATASGKTELSLEVARALDAEIVSVDSMQIYRGMDIGTAKPDPATRTSVPHHLVDIADPDEDITVAAFQQLARAAIEDISSRGRLPLLVGGSGLYYRAVVDPLEFPPRSPEVRKRLEAEAETIGPKALHARLAEIDPIAATKMEPGNARRTIRALEVIETTGARFSDNTSWDSYESIYDLAVVGLTLDRGSLYERIGQRVERMLEEGLVAETHSVSKKGMGRTARQALGYRQILDAMEGEPRDEIVRATKRFARRQESWFRADPRIRWFDVSEPRLAERVVAAISQRLRLSLPV